MRISTLNCGLVLLILSFPAGAHARLQSASPADGSVITASPSSFMLSFSMPVHLTALWIKKDDEPRQNLQTRPMKLSQRFSVPAPRLLPGRYELGWRVFSADSHVAAGQIRFTIAPARPAADIRSSVSSTGMM